MERRYSSRNAFTMDLTIAVALSIAPTAFGQAPPNRDELRAENISDQEVRQIQAVLGQVTQGEIVHIDGVVKNCDCEKAPVCSGQVSVRVQPADGSLSKTYRMSRMNDAWRLGLLQQWRLRYEAFSKRVDKALSQPREDLGRRLAELAEEEYQLLAEHPPCLPPPRPRLQRGRKR